MCNWQSSSVRAATFRNEICPDGAGQSGKREMDSSREKKRLPCPNDQTPRALVSDVRRAGNYNQ